MWNRREMLGRILRCQQAGVPITNYGLTIAYSLGIFARALEPFPAALAAYRQAAMPGNIPCRRAPAGCCATAELSAERQRNATAPRLTAALTHVNSCAGCAKTDPGRLEELWRRADDTRRQHVGDAVHLRGLIEISNHCVPPVRLLRTARGQHASWSATGCRPTKSGGRATGGEIRLRHGGAPRRARIMG